MIGIDTNVWVRYVTNDDPVQARKALKLLQAAEDIFVPKTVLLELEWVLRAVYALPGPSIERAILQIAGLPNVRVEAPQQVADALDLFRTGADFADALHLVGSGEVEAFYTFDAKFVRSARKAGATILSP